MKLSEAANRVIDLAGKVREYYETELRKRYPNYPLVGLDEETVPPPPQEKELSDFLATLSDEIIYQLMLIVHLVRGRCSVDDLGAHYESLKDTVGDPEEAAEEMMWFKASLADELSDGLEELREHKINVDKMLLKKVKVRKR